jgi:hypothetical protein
VRGGCQDRRRLVRLPSAFSRCSWGAVGHALAPRWPTRNTSALARAPRCFRRPGGTATCTPSATRPLPPRCSAPSRCGPPPAAPAAARRTRGTTYRPSRPPALRWPKKHPHPTRPRPPAAHRPQDFKIKFAKARAAENPDLADTYAAKIASMKAQGGWRGLGARPLPGAQVRHALCQPTRLSRLRLCTPLPPSAPRLKPSTSKPRPGAPGRGGGPRRRQGGGQPEAARVAAGRRRGAAGQDALPRGQRVLHGRRHGERHHLQDGPRGGGAARAGSLGRPQGRGRALRVGGRAQACRRAGLGLTEPASSPAPCRARPRSCWRRGPRCAARPGQPWRPRRPWQRAPCPGLPPIQPPPRLPASQTPSRLSRPTSPAPPPPSTHPTPTRPPTPHRPRCLTTGTA